MKLTVEQIAEGMKQVERGREILKKRAHERLELVLAGEYAEQMEIGAECPECGGYHTVKVEFVWDTTDTEWVVDDEIDLEGFRAALQEREKLIDQASSEVCGRCQQADADDYARDLQHYWASGR